MSLSGVRVREYLCHSLQLAQLHRLLFNECEYFSGQFAVRCLRMVMGISMHASSGLKGCWVLNRHSQSFQTGNEKRMGLLSAFIVGGELVFFVHLI